MFNSPLKVFISSFNLFFSTCGFPFNPDVDSHNSKIIDNGELKDSFFILHVIRAKAKKLFEVFKTSGVA